jgi:hypothetical protein
MNKNVQKVAKHSNTVWGIVCVLVAVQVSTMSSPHTISDAFITCTTKRYWWILLGSIVLYTSVLLPFFIYQLRSVRDAFHIRTELLFSFISVTIFPIICLCFVLLPPKNAMAMHVYSYALLGILVGINVTLHAISTIFPLLEALRLDRISAMSVSFEEVMADTMNFEKVSFNQVLYRQPCTNTSPSIISLKFFVSSTLASRMFYSMSGSKNFIKCLDINVPVLTQHTASAIAQIIHGPLVTLQ